MGQAIPQSRNRTRRDSSCRLADTIIHFCYLAAKIQTTHIELNLHVSSRNGWRISRPCQALRPPSAPFNSRILVRPSQSSTHLSCAPLDHSCTRPSLSCFACIPGASSVRVNPECIGSVGPLCLLASIDFLCTPTVLRFSRRWGMVPDRWVGTQWLSPFNNGPCSRKPHVDECNALRGLSINRLSRVICHRVYPHWLCMPNIRYSC